MCLNNNLGVYTQRNVISFGRGEEKTKPNLSIENMLVFFSFLFLCLIASSSFAAETITWSFEKPTLGLISGK